MFNIGDYVVCGNNGVCKVESIGTLDVSGISKDRAYYTMDKVYSKGSKVYIPVDNTKTVLRKVISKDEAYSLIDNMNTVEELTIDIKNRKKADVIKESIQKHDCIELMRVLKTLHISREAKLSQGKKLTALDDNYYRLAEDNLIDELAISMELDREDVRNIISEKVKLL